MYYADILRADGLHCHRMCSPTSGYTFWVLLTRKFKHGAWSVPHAKPTVWPGKEAALQANVGYAAYLSERSIIHTYQAVATPVNETTK